MSTRSWTLTIPAPVAWLNANDRHDRRRGSPLTKQWRDAAHLYARSAKLPHLGKAHITATLRFRDRRRRDPHNYYPTIKAVIDGLVDYGLLADDSSEYLVGPDVRLGEVLPTVARRPYLPSGQVVLTIREAA
jgi:crossover junction endodeoxyribonuclease RusA